MDAGPEEGSAHMGRTGIFVIYSHTDDSWLSRLVQHLAVRERSDRIQTCSDLSIDFGQTSESELEDALSRSRIAVLMLSPAFFASDSIWRFVMPRIFRHQDDSMQVLPIIVRPCAWRLKRRIANLRALPPTGRALALLGAAEADSELASVVYAISSVVDRLRADAPMAEESDGTLYRLAQDEPANEADPIWRRANICRESGDHAATDRAARTEELRHAVAGPTHSPLYEPTARRPSDPSNLSNTDLFHERVDATAEFRERLAAAQQAQDPAGIRAVQASLGDLRDVDPDLAVQILKEYLTVEAYDDVLGLVEAMPSVIRSTPHVQERLAFALNRLGQREEAEKVLLRLLKDRGGSNQTYGLLGRVYRDQWQAALAGGAGVKAAGLLDKAISAYLDGFDADRSDPYPGINAVQLMHARDPDDPRIGDLLPVVRDSARLEASGKQGDFWGQATLLELAVLDNDADAAWAALASTLATNPIAWQARSALDTLARLRTARERTRPAPDWMHEIEAELAKVSSP